MPDVKGFNSRAAALRTGPSTVYGMVLEDIQALLPQWIRDYGLHGMLSIQWQMGDGGFHTPVLIPQRYK